MTQLILGCAQFNPAGYDGKVLTIKEIRAILDCAKAGGINILDTAESYGCNELLRTIAKGFCIYTKTRDWKVQLDWGKNELRGILYHYQPQESQVELPFVHRWVNLGVSVYDINQLPENKQRIIQVPFNLRNTMFRDVFKEYRTVFVRSVFDRGQLLDEYTIADCLWYVKLYRPDGIIVGVQSVKELEMILKEMN